MLGLVVLILLILFLVGGIAPLGTWQPGPYHGYGYGNGGIGVVGILLVVVVVLLLTGTL